MKVCDFVKKYRVCSNAKVRLKVSTIGMAIPLKDWDLRCPPQDGLFGLTLQSFDVIDNVVTIYAKGE